MYITTFYSFKGGVGRTMALVNVAAELASRGKRVLIVDFDLEAPGLDTFDLGRTAASTPGIVDFVSEYLSTGAAPGASGFLAGSSGSFDGGGRVWIMPSGAQDSGYAARLASIDWTDLYENHDGYLLFEDLKLQWQAEIDPDYVLLDSRTGYTDIGGICTRHLPDAVVVLFFPNDQNLRGLTQVVHDIRAEKDGPRQKQIDLHFVLSNVPDLDDEDAILENIIQSFRQDLGFRREPLFIHRYASLSLLNQVVFTKDRPKSRLARQYVELASEILRYNPEDRDGALDYIERVQALRRSTRAAPRPADRRLQRIRKHHSQDGEILFRLGRTQYLWEDALGLFDESIEAGYVEPEVYLARAGIRRSQLDDRDGASHDALVVLDSDEASALDVYRALRLLTSRHWERVPASPALRSLSPSERLWIARRNARSTPEAAAMAAILDNVLKDRVLSETESTDARHALVLCLIALGRSGEALDLIQAEQSSIPSMTITFAFNYGFAQWMEGGQPDRQAFERVVVLDRDDPEPPSNANYHQCLALANWAISDLTESQIRAKAALREIRRQTTSFSCWRYLELSASAFRDDIIEMMSMMTGEAPTRPGSLPNRS